MKAIDKIIAWELELLRCRGIQSHWYVEMIQMTLAGQLHPEKLISGTIHLNEVVIELPNLREVSPPLV